MLDCALNVLNTFFSFGFDAYIVGGFVRDYILGINGDDIDIATNATPKDIMKIFKGIVLPKEEYGSVRLCYKKYRFEITTFRKEIRYLNNRKPVEIEYIDNLLDDLKRRDFKMNTLCMDKDGNIIDLLGGKKDIENRIINTVGDAGFKFEQDSLRIMRAIRFATILKFNLNNDVKNAIIKHSSSLRGLSFDRKREELDKIFTSCNSSFGISLILELGIDKDLQLYDLDKVIGCTDLLGIWSFIDKDNVYIFRKNEKDIIRKVREVLDSGISLFSLYKYGLYINQVASFFLGMDKQSVTLLYENLTIKSRKEIDISSDDIIASLCLKDFTMLNSIYNDLEKEIILNNLFNNRKDIIEYIKKKYRG